MRRSKATEGKMPPHDEVDTSDTSFEDKDTIIRVVAQALYKVAVENAEQSVSGLSIPSQDIYRAFKEALAATDRAAAIAIFALVEDLLMHFLKMQLNPDIKGGHKALFEGSGILSTASSRITLAASLYWIHAETYNDLNILRQIRNTFAHRIQAQSFLDKPIIDYIASMSKRETGWTEAVQKLETGNVFLKSDDAFDARTRFLVRALHLIRDLCEEMSLYPAARSHRVSPDHIFNCDQDQVPAKFQELYKVLATLYLELTVV